MPLILLTFFSPRILRAYGLAYASTTGPRLLSLLFSCYAKSLDQAHVLASVSGLSLRTSSRSRSISPTPEALNPKDREAAEPPLKNAHVTLKISMSSDSTNFCIESFKLYRILVGSMALHKLPAFCAALAGGYTFLQIPLKILLGRTRGTLQSRRRNFKLSTSLQASRAIAAFLSAWFSLQLLNYPRERGGQSQAKQPQPNAVAATAANDKFDSRNVARPTKTLPPLLSGRSMDLTLFAVTRAIEAVVGDLWSCHKARRVANSRWTSTEAAISRLVDAGVFAISSGTVMWAWIYVPDRLPRAYNKWIQEAAQVDHRLLKVLRKARWGEFVYGKDTGVAPILQSMCKEYGWPLSWGDPAVTIPLPCEMVHMGTGKSCHYHAVSRFARAFKFAFATYLPLQILVKARGGTISTKALQKACKEALRSSAFLGAFIGLFYYGVCLSRTQVGYKLVSPKIISPMMWDQGLCIRAGCALCGFSILIEAEKKRQEVAMFVAPRAVATLLPRMYEEKVGRA